MPPGYSKSGLYARKSEQRLRGAPDLELVHSDSNRTMFTVNSDASAEDIQAELARRGDAMTDERPATSREHWMISGPRVPIVKALRKLMNLTTVKNHTPRSIETISNSMERLVDRMVVEEDERVSGEEFDSGVSAMLNVLTESHFDDRVLEASGIYSGVESLLICSVPSIRNKAVKLVNMWRNALTLPQVDIEMTAIANYSPARLEALYGSIKKRRSDWDGAFFGLFWATHLAKCDDTVLRYYSVKTLHSSASYFLPRWNSDNIRDDLYVESLLRELYRVYPVLKEGYWREDKMNVLGALRTHVDRWNVLTKTSDMGELSPENVLERCEALFGRASFGGQAAQVPPNSTGDYTNEQYRYENDHDDCSLHGDFNMTSKFYSQTASASFQALMSSLKDETEYLGTKMKFQDFDQFRAWFDDNTKLCEGVLSRLDGDIAELHAAWPQMLCILESNIRKSILGKELYVAMRETLQNMENDIAAYCENVSKSEAKLARADLKALRTRCEMCAPSERYSPSSCDIHRVQDRLMGMICRPVKAVSEMEWRRVQQTKQDWDDAQSELVHFKTQRDEVRTELSNARSRISTLEAKLKTTKTKLAGAERTAEAKAHIEIEKQKSRYYQDVEKGISETSSALRSQLDAARAEGLLYRQTLADNEKLNAEMAKMRQEMVHLRAVKSQKEKDCKLAEDATKAITEGYDQLKETAATAEARNAELEADLEKALEERDHLRSEASKLRAGKKSAGPPQASATANYANFTPTSLEEKNKKELEHLDSTIVVWKKALADTEEKRDMAKEKKEQVDLRIAHVEKQIKELKAAKKPKTNSSSTATPWGIGTPSVQQPAAAPVQPANSIIVPSAVRKTSPEKEQFPALGSAPGPGPGPGLGPSDTLHGDAPIFSSMRIMNPTPGGSNTRGLASRSAADRHTAGSKKGSGGGWGN